MKHNQGQAIIEYTFAIVIIALLIFGLIKMFQWTGMDYAARSWSLDHDTFCEPGSNSCSTSVMMQLGGGERTKRLNAFTRNF